MEQTAYMWECNVQIEDVPGKVKHVIKAQGILV